MDDEWQRVVMAAVPDFMLAVQDQTVPPSSPSPAEQPPPTPTPLTPARGQTSHAAATDFQAALHAATLACDAASDTAQRLSSAYARVTASMDKHVREASAQAEAARRARATAAALASDLAMYDSVPIIAAALGVTVEPALASEAAAALKSAEHMALTGEASPYGGLPYPVAPALLPLTKAPSIALGSVTAHSAGPLLAQVLDHIDVCIQFFAANPKYRDAAAYSAQLLALQNHCFKLISQRVHVEVLAACEAARKSLQPRGGGAQHDVRALSQACELTSSDMMQLHISFRSSLVHLAATLQLLEDRCNRRAVADALRDAYEHYALARSALVTDVLQSRLAPLTAAACEQLAAKQSRTEAAGGSFATREEAASPGVGGAATTQQLTATSALRSAATMAARAVTAESSLFFSVLSPVTHAAHGANVRRIGEQVLLGIQEDVCAVWAHYSRPIVLATSDIDDLCDLVHMLRDDFMADTSVSAMAPFIRAAGALVRDVQERVYFLAANYIFSNLATPVPRGKTAPTTHWHALNTLLPAYRRVDGSGSGAVQVHGVLVGGMLRHASPQPALTDAASAPDHTAVCAPDVDYPAALLAFYIRQRAAAAQTLSASRAGSNAGPASPPASSHATPRRGGAAPHMYEAWHPVVERVLVLLSKLYRVVEGASFDMLAQDAVAQVTRVLVDAHAAIAAAHKGVGSVPTAATRVVFTPDASDAPTDAAAYRVGLFAAVVPLPEVGALGGAAIAARHVTSLDADLFLIKNLLIVREQLSPFDVQTNATSKSLDFRSTSEAFSSLLAHLPQVLRLSRDNALLSFVMNGLPTVSERRVCFKQELEQLLRQACERAIVKLRGVLLNPLEVWLASHPLRGGDSVDKPNPAACAHALCQAHAALTAVHDVLRAQLAAVRRRVGFYLGSSVTASVLFKPVRDHMAASLLSAQDVATELASHVSEEDTLFESTGVRGVSVMMAALTALIRAASALLDASDELIVDPTHDMFGCDELVLPAPASAVLPGAAGV